MKPRRNGAGNTVWMSWKGKPEDAKAPHYIYGAGWDLCKCPYGQPGDRLWVKETWAYEYDDDGQPVRPDSILYAVTHDWEGPRLSSTQMPRWASRILLEIVSVRVERLKDIGAADVMAEGIQKCTKDGDLWKYGWDGLPWVDWYQTPAGAYAGLWDTINGKPNMGKPGPHGQIEYLNPTSWRANPWVWVVEFKRVTA